ncbi:MAG TPA: ABC transporter substrate-binding protein [Candidatus Acidoferrum sp.]|nr:ABC transporter substrate-binding protein [Candidatus Acidoferrum sp.]
MRIATGVSMLGVTFLTLAFLAPNPVLAQTALVDGFASEPRSADPFFYAEAPTNALNRNLYDGLTRFDADYKLQPALAEKWEAVDDQTWIFHLVKGVKFHDGTPLTAEDVKFSVTRCATWAKSNFKDSVAQIDRVEVVDPYTVKIVTKGPFGILPSMMSRVMIMSKAYVEKTGDDAQATKPNGTGAYKLTEWVRGDHLTLVANEGYFLGAPKIKQVIIRPLTNAATRTAALLSGEVHVMDDVSVRDVDRVKANPKLDLLIRESDRVIYLEMDQVREKSPRLESPTGKNPFLDVRVRRAFLLGINEEAIVKHVMNGFAAIAGQMVPPMVYGFDESIKRPAYDPEKAKALLKEAGYANGFTVTLDAPNDRYVNDAQIAQAVAADLARIGVRVTVNAIPKNTFFPMTDRRETSFDLMGWACNPPDAIRFMTANAHSDDPKLKLGAANAGNYTNPKVDKLIETVSRTVKADERLRLLRDTQRLLMEDVAFIPLHTQVNIHAKVKRLQMKLRADAYHIYHEMDLSQ